MSLPVEFRQRIERVIAYRIIKDALKAGLFLTLNDGEEDVVDVSNDEKKLRDALMTTDEDVLFFHRAADDISWFGWVRLIYGNDGWDVMSDYTTTLEELLTGANLLAEKYSELFGYGSGIVSAGEHLRGGI